ncbi:MAG: hypothetical protein JWM98_2474, partial [Thermoleophilia bacterium]|nr:hypothetical protein [Thermoleophilia bacterium]
AETTPVRLARVGAAPRPGIGRGGSGTADAGWAIGEVERRDPDSPGAKLRITAEQAAAASDALGGADATPDDDAATTTEAA